MTLEFRDHQILVISPGSAVCQAQMGLAESLMPPAFEIPTVVYRARDTGRLSVQPAPDADVVHPIVQGRIANEEALAYLLTKLYASVKPVDGLPPAVYLLASLQWTRRQIERLSRVLFEEARVPALAVAYQGVATCYAFATPDALIIDVGLDKTEISAVLALELRREASRVVNGGGNAINQALQTKLPQYSADQIEDLKLSGICEVLGADQHKSRNQAFAGGLGDEEEDGVVDVAAIVASGNAREILERREEQKTQNADPNEANASRHFNSFTDRQGNTLSVGQERFEGADWLLNAITSAVADVLYNLEPKEQQRAFDNLVITGRGSLMPGFAAQLADRLDARYVVRSVAAFANRAPSLAPIGTPSTTAGTPAPTEDPENAAQSPTSLSLVPFPSHFPEWRTRKWTDYQFLGAQIGAKQVLTMGVEGLFVSRQDYNEMGPASVWDTFN